MVSSATRRPPPRNSIATSVTPAASASISVWPGHGWPAAARDSLFRGAVTIASTRPDLTSPTARSTDAAAARPAAGEVRPRAMGSSEGTSTTRAPRSCGQPQAETFRTVEERRHGPVDDHGRVGPLRGGEGAQDDLGADPGGVADGHGKRELVSYGARADVPEVDGALPASRGHRLAVGREGDAEDGGGVAAEGQDLPPGSDVPELHGLVPAPGREPRAVGREGHGLRPLSRAPARSAPRNRSRGPTASRSCPSSPTPASCRPGRSARCAPCPRGREGGRDRSSARRRVPQLDVVAGSRDQRPAVGREGHGEDGRSAAVKDARPSVPCRRPRARRSRPRTRRRASGRRRRRPRRSCRAPSPRGPAPFPSPLPRGGGRRSCRTQRARRRPRKPRTAPPRRGPRNVRDLACRPRRPRSSRWRRRCPRPAAGRRARRRGVDALGVPREDCALGVTAGGESGGRGEDEPPASQASAGTILQPTSAGQSREGLYSTAVGTSGIDPNGG